MGVGLGRGFLGGGGWSNMRVRVRWVFCWDEGELVLCGRMVQGRWGCLEGE